MSPLSTAQPSAPPGAAASTPSSLEKAGRIVAIDVLRGCATLGILIINIAVFSMPFAMDNPMNYGGTEAVDLWSWIANKLLFEGSMRAIFSMLFGASALLLLGTLERDAARARLAADIYYRRTLWLFAFGVIHGTVMLWPGDVLYVYALAGLVLYPFRNLPGRRLLLIGMLVVMSMLPRYLYWLYEDVRLHNAAVAAQERVAQHTERGDEQKDIDAWYRRNHENQPPKEKFQERIEGMRGNYLQVLKTTLPSTKYEQSWKTYELRFWDALGMMFFGMGLLKLGVFTGERERRYYLKLCIAGYAIGFALKSWEIQTLIAQRFHALAYSVTQLVYEFSRLSVALGHIAAVMLLWRAGLFGFLARPLQNVGRMALTNYMSQTVLCALIFYGIGFGLYGRLDRHELYYVVAGIWALQLAWSTWWLNRYRYGPLEWAWRSLTYWSWQPLKHRAPTSAPAAGAAGPG